MRRAPTAGGLVRSAPPALPALACAVALLAIGSAGAPARAAALTAAAPQQNVEQVSVPRGSLDTPLSSRARSFLGIVVLTGAAWLLSVDRKRVAWRVVAWGMALQLAFAVFILKTPVGDRIFSTAN